MRLSTELQSREKKLNNKLEKEMFSKLLVPSFHPIHHHWCHLQLFSSSTNGFEREGIPPLLGLALFLEGERR